jgi:hypothetical protein
VSFAALAALSALAIVTLLARRTVQSPTLGRLRAVLPSWRLFDRAVASPQLQIRFAEPAGAGALGAWQPVERPPRRATRWAFAPAGNLGLAYHALVVQLVAELAELELDEPAEAAGRAEDPLAGETDPAVVGLVSYELVTRVARAHVPAGARFQWKIVVPGPAAPVDYVRSPVVAA